MTITYTLRLNNQQPTMALIKKLKVKHAAWLMTEVIGTENNCLRIKVCPSPCNRRKATVSFAMSVRLSAWNNSAPTG